MLFSDLAMVGLVGYGTGQPLWKSTTSSPSPSSSSSFGNISVQHCGGQLDTALWMTFHPVFHLASFSRDENTDNEPNTLWFRLERVGIGRACSRTFIFSRSSTSAMAHGAERDGDSDSINLERLSGACDLGGLRPARCSLPGGVISAESTGHYHYRLV